jgi:predicted RNase H-like HicB family nuclease
MSIPDREIIIEYDEQNGDCHVIMEPGKAIGLGTTHRDALEDLREAAHFYIDTTIDMKLTELVRGHSAERRQENGSI